MIDLKNWINHFCEIDNVILGFVSNKDGVMTGNK